MDKNILVELENFAETNHVPIARPEVAKLLVVLGNLLKPLSILEVGTAIGYSSILLSSVLKPGGRIDTVERNEKRYTKAKENIKKAELDGVINVILGDALEVLGCLSGPYDMIFMDAAKGQYVSFLPDCLRMLSPGGLLVSDNVLYKGMTQNDELVVRRQKTIVRRMREYLDILNGSEELTTCVLPVGDGVAVSYRKASSQILKN